MADSTTTRLDEAYEALRAWCHERPDLSDPAGSYGAFGVLGAIVTTLEHIVQLTARSAARATGVDDDRNITEACERIGRYASEAIESLEDCHRMIGEAHSITSHLIFAPDDKCETDGLRSETA